MASVAQPAGAVHGGGLHSAAAQTYRRFGRRTVFTSILVAVDRSEDARAAVRVASDIARADGAALTLMTVHTSRVEAQVTLDQARALVPPGIQQHSVLRDGRPVEAILEEAESGHDLVVVGSGRRGDAASLLLGSVGRQILQRSRVAVVLVHVPPVRQHDVHRRVTWSRAAGGAHGAPASPCLRLVTRVVERRNAPRRVS
jgi:nucleotide-binding universal stress UspA family protein